MQNSILKLCCQMTGQRFLLSRTINNLQQTAGLKRISLEQLGLPPKPIKPLTPFFKFMQQARTDLVKRNPGSKMTDVSKIISAEWTKVDREQKKQMNLEYKKELDIYKEADAKYESELTQEQRLALQDAQIALEEEITKKAIKQKMKEFGKPKRPLVPFMIFMKDCADKRGDISTKEWMIKMGTVWQQLPADEKAVYESRSTELQAKYAKSLKRWEDKMINQGNLSLVRKTALNERQAKAVAATRIVTIKQSDSPLSFSWSNKSRLP